MRNRNRELRLWAERGRQYMAFGGDETDHVAVSPSLKWYCGVFLHSNLVILGNTRGRVVRFGAGMVMLIAVDDEGRAAILEEGSNHARVRVLWPDGATSQPRLKNAASILSLSLESGTLECEFADERRGFALAEMERSAPKRNVVMRTEKSRSWLGLAIAVIVIYLILKHR